MIFISAGHYDKYKGATFEGFNEHDEAILWRDGIAKLLGDRSKIVPPGRLMEKVKFINQGCHILPGPHIAIEIHFNSAVRVIGVDDKMDNIYEHIGEGSESLYYPNSHYGKELANIIQDYLSIPFGPNRGAKEGWYRMDKQSGIIDWFLAETACPALIIEPDFIHRSEKINEGRDVGIAVIANALLEIIGE